MNCTECSDLLSQYIDKECSQQTVQEIEKHIITCSHCKEEHDHLVQTINCVCDLECVEPPLGFHARLMDKIEEEASPGFAFPVWGGFSLGAVATAAVVLTIIVVGPFEPKELNHKLTSNISTNQLAPVAQFETSSLQTSDNQQWENFYKKENLLPSQVALQSRKKRYTSNRMLPGLVRQAGYGQGTGRKQAPVQMRQPSKVEKLYRQGREWQGEASHLTTALQVKISSLDEAKQLWEKTGISPIPVDNMDWKKNNLIAIFTGPQKGSGYEIELKNMRKTETHLEVYYSLNGPGLKEAEKSHPFLIVEIRRTALPVKFIEQK